MRIDLIVFIGFAPGAGALPDASTICDFRKRLAKVNARACLLEAVNRQLERTGLKVSGNTPLQTR